MSEDTKNVQPDKFDEHSTPPADEVTPDSTPETGGDEVVTLPDDHPLVKTLEAQKEQIRKLKERAQKLDELEQAQMTEAEKAAARLEAAEKRASALEKELALKDLVITHRLSEKDTALLTELTEHVTDIDAMSKIAERLATEEQPQKRSPKPHPAQHQPGGDTPTDEDEIANRFFGFSQ